VKKTNFAFGILATVTVILMLCSIAILISGITITASFLTSPNHPTAIPTLGISIQPTAHPTKHAIQLPRDKLACESLNGRWGRIGLAPTEQCNLPTSDAGRVCNDSSDCDSLCIADLTSQQRDGITRTRSPIITSGRCAPWVVTVGCIPIVEQGIVRSILCID
jgi:hypothetical protein